jgi:citrate lyase subunit beta/citryl-CoA lyase
MQSRPVRPRRSVLYMPGSNARALEKAAALPADALILDLEDAVAPDAKAEARAAVSAIVARRPYGRREVAIRVNALAGPGGRDDLAAAAASGCDAILLPKVESAAQVGEAAALMERHGSPAEQTLWCMIETPLGVLNAAPIAAAHPRLACFVMGTSDLAKDLHAGHTRERQPMLTSLGLSLLAARAHGLAIVDGVHLALDDEAGLEHACRHGVELGFDGKTLIHPKQIATANRLFAPSAAELDQASKIIAAHRAAEQAGKGVVVVDGRLVENLHVANARRLLALAEAIAALEAV